VYRPPNSSFPGLNSLLDVDSTIRGLTQDFCTAFNTGNYDQAAAIFAADGMLMLSHCESAEGPKGIERALRQYGDSGHHKMRLETLRVEHSGDMAFEMGRYTVSGERGNSSVADTGKFLRVWRRLGASRIVGDSWSSSVPEIDHETKAQEGQLGGGTKVA
jgi:ketosteroid isomerase-like protein